MKKKFVFVSNDYLFPLLTERVIGWPMPDPWNQWEQILAKDISRVCFKYKDIDHAVGYKRQAIIDILYDCMLYVLYFHKKNLLTVMYSTRDICKIADYSYPNELAGVNIRALHEEALVKLMCAFFVKDHPEADQEVEN